MIAEITDMGYNMEGIARCRGKVIFVPYAIIGETAEIHIYDTKKDYCKGNITHIEKESEHRITPPCPYFLRCGGCDTQHIDKSFLFKIKKDILKNTLSKFKIDCVINDIICGKKQFNYRNKMAFAVRDFKLCMFENNTPLPVTKCLLASEIINKNIAIFNSFFEKYKISSCNEKTKQGIVRHVVMREIDGKILFCVVLNGTLPYQNEFIQMLQSENGNDFGLYINNNLGKDILSGKSRHVYGLKNIAANICGIEFDIDIDSFLQVNNETQELLYNAVIDAVELTQSKTIVNAYSGAGLLSALLAKTGTEVYGIEINAAAHTAAENLKAKYNIKNLKNICGDVYVELKNLQFDTLVLDPPRSGCGESIIQTILNVKPKHIVYVSCNPATLGRDLKLLAGYKIKSITPYEMFANTKHIELLVCLKRNNIELVDKEIL